MHRHLISKVFFLALGIFFLSTLSVSAQSSSAASCQGRLDRNDPLMDGTCSAADACANGFVAQGSGGCSGGQVCCLKFDTSRSASCPAAHCQSGACNSNQVESSACARAVCAPNQTFCWPKTPATGGSTANYQTISFSNPLAFNTVEGLLGTLLQTLQRIIVVLAMIFLVIGAILYIISGGNESRMETGKKAITAALIGLALGLAAPSFLREIGDVLGWRDVNNDMVAQARTLSQIALDVLKFLLSLVGVLGIIMLVIGGLTYLTAYGDEDRLDSAKKMVKYAIIGIIVAFASLIIVAQLASFFGS